jgi:hypothetical protein
LPWSARRHLLGASLAGVLERDGDRVALGHDLHPDPRIIGCRAASPMGLWPPPPISGHVKDAQLPAGRDRTHQQLLNHSKLNVGSASGIGGHKQWTVCHLGLCGSSRLQQGAVLGSPFARSGQSAGLCIPLCGREVLRARLGLGQRGHGQVSRLDEMVDYRRRCVAQPGACVPVCGRGGP